MTGKADFTEEEWQLIREAPTSAGLITVTAERGGSFRESFAMAKACREVNSWAASGLPRLARFRPGRERS